MVERKKIQLEMEYNLMRQINNDTAATSQTIRNEFCGSLAAHLIAMISLD